jgi:hypothetical protein
MDVSCHHQQQPEASLSDYQHQQQAHGCVAFTGPIFHMQNQQGHPEQELHLQYQAGQQYLQQPSAWSQPGAQLCRTPEDWEQYMRRGWGQQQWNGGIAPSPQTYVALPNGLSRGGGRAAVQEQKQFGSAVVEGGREPLEQQGGQGWVARYEAWVLSGIWELMDLTQQRQQYGFM